MPINSGHKDYVVVVAAGYNHGVSPAPLKVYVGMKDRLADGSVIDYATANERDIFLARNGLLYGKIYGMAVDNETIKTLVAEPNPAEKMMEEYLKNSDAPKRFATRWFPTSYQWNGWDNPVAVQDTENDVMGKRRRTTRRIYICLLYTSPSPRDRQKSRMPSSA